MPKDSKKYAILLSLLCSSLFVSLIAQDRHPSYSEVTSLDSTTSKDSATLLSNKPITLLDSISKDSLQSDSLGVDSLANDSVSPKKKKAGLTSVVDYKANDSIVFTHGNEVYMYGKGVVQFDGMELNADQIEMNMDSSLVYAVGRPDSVGDIVGRPVFKDKSGEYESETMNYNFKTKKGYITNIVTQQGEGYLTGGQTKKMENDEFYMKSGRYTTCDNHDHPHFYLQLTQAKVRPKKNIVTGPAYMVLADVPLPLAIPFGFFPFTEKYSSGIIVPTFGDELARGFYLRDGGYYFAINDYIDLALTGEIYTKGSWGINARSAYIKRYKYSGNLNFDFSSVKSGDKGDADYIKQNTFKLQWTHSQDAKANPGSTFSASVNLASSGYSKYSANTLNDMLSTQTNSSISYSKNWAGTPFSLSANMAISQNSQNKTISITLPTMVFNVSRFYPFKRKEKQGKDRWYEKISMQYTGKMTNSVTTTESKVFSKETLENMKNGIEHSIPISASFNLLNYINLSPSVNYNEKWYFKKVEFEWNPVTNQTDTLPTNYGFYRLYNYNFSVSASTTVYGMYDFTKKSRDRKIQAIRHTLTPSIGFSYAPDFSDPKYGYYQTRQTDSTGRFTTYSPYAVNAYGVPSSGRSMSMNFSLSQNLEMKVLSKRDTSGVKKIKLIDELRISGSYNFLADSMGLSNIPVSFRTTLFNNFGINLSLTLDPYRVSPEGKRYNKLFFPGRVVSTGWSFGYTFKSRNDRSETAINDITSIPPEYQNPFYDPYGQMDPVLRRQYMAQSYYDFSLPWNFGFNYAVNYSISYTNNGTTGYRKNVTQTIGFNGSLNVTPKTGITFQGGYDIKANKLTTSSVSITRDLHCWQMSFSWIPFGYHRSWSFNIGVKAASLSDLKYDKSQSMYDNMY